VLLLCTLGLKDNPCVGQFIGAMKTVIIYGLAYRGLLDPDSSGQYAFLSQAIQCFFTQSVDKCHDRETTDHVTYICFLYYNLWCFVCRLLYKTESAASLLYDCFVYCEEI